MTQPSPNPAPAQTPEIGPIDHVAADRSAEIERQGTRNLLILALYRVVLRVGWIFKTESVIMPAFLDAIAGAGWLRGCLPVLNRFGQSVPPLLFAERLQHMQRKKWALFASAFFMAVPFLILSPLWLGMGWLSVSRANSGWLPAVFLLLYAFFFSMTGLNQLAFNTLQGKLVRANRRGRLMTMAGLIGSGCAILCAWYLLPAWLKREGGGFGLIFGMTAAGFVSAGLIVLLINEPADHLPQRNASVLKEHFLRAWETYRDDARFRQLAWTSMIFMSALMLFPHYQAMGRVELGCEQSDLLSWLIAQNLGTGLFSLATGTIADRLGNRMCMRVCMFAALSAPLLALGLAYRWIPGGRDWYWVTFLMLGLTPLTLRCLVNYALELVEEIGHTRYVSTLTLTMALPFLFSPLVGWLVDLWDFPSVFLAATLLILLSGLMTFTLAEPRHDSE